MKLGRAPATTIHLGDVFVILIPGLLRFFDNICRTVTAQVDRV